MPRINFNSDFKVGAACLVIGCLILFAWIPLDVETGLFEKVRSQVSIGDALAPSLAATILILGGILLMFQSFRAASKAGIEWKSLKFLALLLALLGLSMAVIRWAGPITGVLLSADYRSLRDTVPWKYIGYFFGGILMVFSLISMMEGRMRWHTLIISILAVIFLIIVYDVPFESLLLPPNGDF